MEAIEVMETQAAGSVGLVEELGDLLFHIVLQCAIGEEEGTFDLADVAREIHGKMVRRHPHIFDRDPGYSDAEQTASGTMESHKGCGGKPSVK